MTTLSVVKFIASSSSARRTLVEKISNTANRSRSFEPGVTQYAVCVPWDDLSEGPIVTITTYSSDDAYNSHMSSESVQILFDSLQTESLLTSQPEVHRLDPIFDFKKPGLKDADTEKVLIVFAHADMHPGAYERCMPAMKAVNDYCETNEPDTLAYAICKGVDEGENKGFVVEVYKTREYFQDPHMKSAQAQDIVKRIGENADYRDFLQLKVIGGFLAK